MGVEGKAARDVAAEWGWEGQSPATFACGRGDLSVSQLRVARKGSRKEEKKRPKALCRSLDAVGGRSACAPGARPRGSRTES